MPVEMIVDASPTFLQIDRVRVVQMHEHFMFVSVPTAMRQSRADESVCEGISEQSALTERSVDS